MAIFWTEVFWIDLILLLMIKLKEFQRIGRLIAHKGLFKRVKMAFLNDPKCQKGLFLVLGPLDRLDISYDMKLNEFQHYGTLIAHEGSFKSVRNAFLNDPKCQKGGF